MSVREKKSKALVYVLSFLLPCLLLLLAYIRLGVYPFGEKSLLLVDMDNEYVDYFACLNIALREGGGLTRSWNMGMGLNMWGLIAFYAASPFNLLPILMPVTAVTEAILLMTLLKIGLCGLLFCHWAAQNFPEQRRFIPAFSVAYGLLAYNIAYSSNIMWLDGVAFLPLVLLGAERVLQDKPAHILAGSLTYVFLTSYYIGYMAGIFAFLYFTAAFFSRSADWRAYFRKLRRFIAHALLAAGCSAFLLLPAFLNLHNGQTEMWQAPFSLRLRLPLTELLTKLLPGVYDSLTNAGRPNIYATVLGLYLAVLFFLNPAVKRREKAVWGALCGFLLLSFTCELLDLGWHAFEYPTWFPARYSFVFSFLLLFLGLRCLQQQKSLSARRLFAGAALPALLFVEIALLRYDFVDKISIQAGILLLLVYLYFFTLSAMKRNAKDRVLPLLLLLTVAVESGWNAHRMVQGMEKQFEYNTRAGYSAYRQAYAPALDLLKTLDVSVYRTEIIRLRNANGGMALGFKGISHYSSTTDQTLNAFLYALGYNCGTINELRFSRSTPLTNGLLGIRYVLSDQELGEGYRLAAISGNIRIYENKAAFPLAFWVDERAGDFSYSVERDNNPFELQNDWLRAVSGIRSGVFTPVSVQVRPVNLVGSASGGFLHYKRDARDGETRLLYTAQNGGHREIYAYFPLYERRYSQARALTDGGYAQRVLGYRNNSIVPLGVSPAAMLTLELGSDTVRMGKPLFYALDLEQAQAAAKEARRYAMDFTLFTDTAVEGRLVAPRDGLLATTFPYDTGWRVWVDGRKTSPQKYCGVFLSIPLTQGEHTVTMRYAPPGFYIGIAISLCSAAGYIWRLIAILINKRKQNMI